MTRQIKILLVILALLLLGVFAILYQQKILQKPKNNPLFSFTEDQIDSFRINHFTMGLLFQKKDQEWTVKRIKTDLTTQLEEKTKENIGITDEAPQIAKTDEVDRILSELIKIKKTEPVSVLANEPAVFEINEHSLHVIFYDKQGKELDRLFVGKEGPDPASSFVKKANASEVYLAPQNFRSFLLKNFEEWLKEPTK